MLESKLEGVGRCLPFVPTGLLLVIAAVHAYNVHEYGMSPWKGGGFGMFSTADQPTARLVRVFLKNDVEGRTAELPVSLPMDRTNIGRLAMSVRTMPRLGDARRLADALAELPWRIYDRQGSQGDNDRFTIAPEGTRGLLSASGDVAQFTALRVEVRRLKLNTSDWSVSSELLTEVEVRR